MVKIAVDAGHGINTAGKRTPDGEREWSFNNKVVLALISALKKYDNVQILRLDDPTGKNDISLAARTKKANDWGADVLVSVHHNALAGKWGTHKGIETFIFPGGNPASRKIAEAVHPLLVKSMGLSDRGIKTKNLHMVRESKMPSLLTEGGFMDSTIDIKALRDDSKLKKQGEAISKGLANYFKLKAKSGSSNSGGSTTKPTTHAVLSRGSKGTLVGTLQKNLNKVLGTKLVVDNLFGPAVNSALLTFQKKYGLVADGYYGPASQRKMQEVIKNLDSSRTMYKVQVGAFQVKNNADNLKKQLESKGFKPFIATSKNSSGTMHRVQVGAFQVKKNAEALKKQLEDKGFKPIITS